MKMSTPVLRFGIWVNAIWIGLALAYAVSLAAVGASGTGFPPVEPYDMAISIISLISAPAILVFFAVIHAYAPEERKLFSLLALAFSILFTAMTCINRFIHLAVIRPSLAAGVTDGFVFRDGALERALFWVFLIDAVLSLVSTLTPFTGITLFTFVGTIAWGPGFIVACALLIRLFRRELKQSERGTIQAATGYLT